MRPRPKDDPQRAVEPELISPERDWAQQAAAAGAQRVSRRIGSQLLRLSGAEEGTMHASGKLFAIFLGFAALVALGLGVLPGPTAASWTSGDFATLPGPLQAAWLAWFFALWGALVMIVVAVGAWVAEQLVVSEPRPTPGAGAVVELQRHGGAEGKPGKPASAEASRATVARTRLGR